MSLEANNIYASYGKFDILKGVSIRVSEGQIVSVIGPNGAGKSTLLKAIFGILKPSKGTIIFNGQDITNLSPVDTLKAGISYVLQRHTIFPEMTVMENMEMGAYIRNDDKIEEDIEELCKLFPIITERKNKKAKTLSGGERRMVEIARSLVLKPKLLLLDEPTLGLAPKLVDTVFGKINEIHEMRISIIIVEQNAKRALEISDYAYVLELGRNRIEGAGEEILNDERVRKLYLGG